MRAECPTTVPNSPTNGAVAPMVGQNRQASLQLGVHDGLCPLQSAGPRWRWFRSVAWPADARNSCKPAVTTSARCDFLLRSAILMASSSLLSFRAPATFGRELSRLLAGGGEVQVTVDHDGQRPD